MTFLAYFLPKLILIQGPIFYFKLPHIFIDWIALHFFFMFDFLQSLEIVFFFVPVLLNVVFFQLFFKIKGLLDKDHGGYLLLVWTIFFLIIIRFQDILIPKVKLIIDNKEPTQLDKLGIALHITASPF